MKTHMYIREMYHLVAAEQDGEYEIPDELFEKWERVDREFDQVQYELNRIFLQRFHKSG